MVWVFLCGEYLVVYDIMVLCVWIIYACWQTLILVDFENHAISNHAISNQQSNELLSE